MKKQILFELLFAIGFVCTLWYFKTCVDAGTCPAHPTPQQGTQYTPIQQHFVDKVPLRTQTAPVHR